MAQIAPPATEGPQKLSKAQAALIQAEKKKDNATRDQLEKMYGAAQGPRVRRVHLTRYGNQTWKCPQCGTNSRDIRYVCGHCLGAEPGSLSRQRPYKERPPRSGEAPGTMMPPPQWLDPQGPSETRDRGVSLLNISSTQRVYRRFTDPVAPAAKVPKKQGGSHAHIDMDDDDVDDEELEEEEEARAERVYNDAPQGCAPGARFRELTDPRHGDEIDEGEDDDTNDVGVIGDTRPQGNPHSAEAQTRVMPEKPFTHFLSLPIGKLPSAKGACEQLVAQLQQFAQRNAPAAAAAGAAEDGQASAPSASSSAPASALTEDMISPASKLHLTMLLLTLNTPEDVAFASELLQHFKKIWDDTKTKLRQLGASGAASAMQSTSEAAHIKLADAAPHQPLIALGEGLHVMPTGKSNETVNPKKAGVVYMSLRDDSSKAAVRTIQELLHTCFRELIDQPDEAEKAKQLLHMTVVNKKWRHKAAKRPFDATALLNAFGSAAIGQGGFELGAVELNRLSGGNRDAGYFVEASVEL